MEDWAELFHDSEQLTRQVFRPQPEDTHFHIFFTAYQGLGFITLFVQFYSVDLPPIRPHWGEAPSRELNLGRAVQRQGH